VKMQEFAVPKRLDAAIALRSIERIAVGMFKVGILALLFSTWQGRRVAPEPAERFRCNPAYLARFRQPPRPTRSM
jgi:hypothetical protein